MKLLTMGDPWALSTDVGPVIDPAALATIRAHIDTARQEGRVIAESAPPQQGTFVAPTIIEVPGIAAMRREIFGPVLHVARFGAEDLDAVIAHINATGYGLTFGLHSRIDDRVQMVSDAVQAGNIYVNRNQIGAIVGSQPFGGEGLSGTGPKAGGPHYLARFTAPRSPDAAPPPPPDMALTLPGPTGELNELRLIPRAPLLCLGPGPTAAAAQAAAIRAMGGLAEVAEGLESTTLKTRKGFSGALWWGDADTARTLVQALASRPGPILPLLTALPDAGHLFHERHLCVDTTASGGNAALLGGLS